MADPTVAPPEDPDGAHAQLQAVLRVFRAMPDSTGVGDHRLTLGALRLIDQQLSDVASLGESYSHMLGIVLDLQQHDAPVYRSTYTGRYQCALCQAEPPGAAMTLPLTGHLDSCPWRRARETDA